MATQQRHEGGSSQPITEIQDVRSHNDSAIDNGLNINLIISDNYDPYTFCKFKTAGTEVTLAPSLIKRPEDFYPINEIAVGPPQAIISVSCFGVCLGIYGKLNSMSTMC